MKFFNFFLSIVSRQNVLRIGFVAIMFITSCSEVDFEEKSLGSFEPISNNWEVATWKDFKQAAISHTWDDNSANQLTLALPMYNEYDFKATFFITPSWFPDWSGFRNALNQGHEVSSHSMTHPFIYGDSLFQTRYELGESKRIIMENMQRKYPITFSYPFCYVDDIDMMEDYYIAARGCSNQVVYSTIENFMNIGSFILGEMSNYNSDEDFNEIAEKALMENAWSVDTFHAIDNNNAWSPINSNDLRTHLKYLNENRDVYWVDTFANVVKYVKARQQIRIVPTENSTTIISAEIWDDFDDDIYNIPLTFKKEIPKSWSVLSVYHGDEEISHQRVRQSSKTYVIFDVIPDGREVRILLDQHN
jgi:peptidoglycan/xylan/chitin deacetylase (PgdA/CDA1 family)